MFNQQKYYVAAGDKPAVHDAFVHLRTVQELLNREGGTVPSACLGRLRISRTTLGGLNPERGSSRRRLTASSTTATTWSLRS